MSEHEQRMAAARAYLAETRAADVEPEPTDAGDTGERRGAYDVRAHLARLQRSCDEEREALGRERLLNRVMRDAVVLFGKRIRIVFWLTALLASAVFGVAFYTIDRNREAVEVSCLVVVQVVRDSGANSGKPRETRAGKAQARITARIYKTVLAQMSPRDRAGLLRDQAIVRRAGGAIPEPQCREIARDPTKVRRETLQTPP